MGGCRCTYKHCKSATKNTANLHFFHYPVKHPERCGSWIKNTCKPSFLELPEEQLRNKVVCGLHFEERYFTNTNRKRLVHDAIPTLDGNNQQPILPVKDVKVLPSSIDGSTFTLQADHLQPGTSQSSDPMETSGDSNDNIEAEVFTIDPSYIEQSFFNRNNTKDIFLHTDNNESSSIIFKLKKEAEEESPKIYENSDCESMISATTQSQTNNLVIDEDTSNSNLQNVYFNESDKKQLPPKSKKRRFIAERNVLKRINMHTQEIANIKRSLSVKHHFPRKRIMQMLRGRIPDTLLGALSLQLFKTQKDLVEEEKLFLQAMHTIAPNAYKKLQEIGWFIPNHVIIDRTQTKT